MFFTAKFNLNMQTKCFAQRNLNSFTSNLQNIFINIKVSHFLSFCWVLRLCLSNCRFLLVNGAMFSLRVITCNSCVNLSIFFVKIMMNYVHIMDITNHRAE